MVYVGFWRRFVALGIMDGIILNLVCLGLVSPLLDGLFPTDSTTADAMRNGMTDVEIIGLMVQILLGVVYDVFFIASNWQATPGKRIMGIKVVTKEGRRLTLLHSLGRHLTSLVCGFFTCGISYMLAGWTKEKTALHDMICGTRVVFANSLPDSSSAS